MLKWAAFMSVTTHLIVTQNAQKQFVFVCVCVCVCSADAVCGPSWIFVFVEVVFSGEQITMLVSL